MSDEFDHNEYPEERHQRPRDRVVDEAKEVLLEKYFPKGATTVYYGRQLVVGLEKRFFPLDHEQSSKRTRSGQRDQFQ